MFAKELLSAQAAGSTRLPVHLNRLPRWRSWACHDPYRRCRPESNIAVDEKQPISEDPHVAFLSDCGCDKVQAALDTILTPPDRVQRLF